MEVIPFIAKDCSSKSLVAFSCLISLAYCDLEHFSLSLTDDPDTLEYHRPVTLENGLPLGLSNISLSLHSSCASLAETALKWCCVLVFAFYQMGHDFIFVLLLVVFNCFSKVVSTCVVHCEVTLLLFADNNNFFSPVVRCFETVKSPFSSVSVIWLFI